MGRTDTAFPLGRLEPMDFDHVDAFPFGAVAPETVDHVERLLQLPGWRSSHNQGREGSCVGHAVALERAIVNRAQAVARGDRRPVRYDPIHLWNEAKRVDEWPGTNPGDNQGTSVRAAYDVARSIGLSRVRTVELGPDLVPRPIGAQAPDASSGVVDVNRWATSSDEVRTAIAQGRAVAIGVSWYRSCDVPGLVKRGRDFYVPEGLSGGARGGHSVCLAGASDRRQAFRLVNSWGPVYPLVWLPYATLDVLLAQGGEAAVVTDR